MLKSLQKNTIAICIAEQNECIEKVPSKEAILIELCAEAAVQVSLTMPSSTELWASTCLTFNDLFTTSGSEIYSVISLKMSGVKLSYFGEDMMRTLLKGTLLKKKLSPRESLSTVSCAPKNHLRVRVVCFCHFRKFRKITKLVAIAIVSVFRYD